MTTQELNQKALEIGALTTGCDNVNVAQQGNYFLVTLRNQYDYVSFKQSILMSYMAIAEILGCKDGDEINKECEGEGCETCGYGSSYLVELKFW